MRQAILILVTLLSFWTIGASAQRRVSADVEVKIVAKGKVSTVTKSVYCSSNGRLVTYFKSPVEYYMTTNLLGENQLYMPQTNEVISETNKDNGAMTELLYIFMSGHADDLALGLSGYKLSSTQREEGGLIKRVYTLISGPQNAKVEVVYENFLPIYSAYYDEGGKVIRKNYFSQYDRSTRMVFPMRVTTIDYGSKRDSTVVRSVYSNLKLDGDDPKFDFVVPSDAKKAL